MITVRQIARLWAGKDYTRLLGQLLAPRSEASSRLTADLVGVDAAAAVLIVRLDELSQSFAPLYSEAVRSLVRNQRPDGGWGDPMTTAAALRALLCGNGHGPVVERGLHFLAALQRDEGIWPAEPVRRMPADAFASAFILVQLGDHVRFRETVRFAEAIAWFTQNELALDDTTRRLWRQAKTRCQMVTGLPAVSEPVERPCDRAGLFVVN